MIINSSCIGMDSARIYTSVRMDASVAKSGTSNNFPGSLKDKSLLPNNDNAKESPENPGAEEKTKADSLSETLEDIRSRYDFLKVNNPYSSKLEQDAISKVRTQCLQYLLKMLLGHSRSHKDDEPSWDNYTYSTGKSEVSFNSGYTTISETRINSHYFSESEETHFSTTGKVLTSDGRSIDFNLDLSMSRSFSEYYETRSDFNTVLCDPLVINLDSGITEVSDMKFKFDLDADGTPDQISTLSSNSGFLALDINEDGVINDGSELFGTKSGNGFKDLSKYDSDGNGWIDEADEIFDKLKIFMVDADGNQTLLSLKDKDIGAIYLGNISTDFTLKSESSNETNAVIRSTGIFLYENGSAGTIQHVDLAKAEYSA